MDTAIAISVLLNLLTSAAELGLKLQAISQIIQKAQAEGRAVLTDEEWEQVVALDDTARAELQASISV